MRSSRSNSEAALKEKTHPAHLDSCFRAEVPILNLSAGSSSKLVWAQREGLRNMPKISVPRQMIESRGECSMSLNAFPCPKASLFISGSASSVAFLSNLFLKNDSGNPLPLLGNLSWELGCISQVSRFAFHCNSSGELPFTCRLVVVSLHKNPPDKTLCGLLPSRAFCPWVRAGAVRELLCWLGKDGCKLWVCM